MFINYKFNLEFFQYSYIREILDVRLDTIIYSSLVRTRPESIIRDSIEFEGEKEVLHGANDYMWFAYPDYDSNEYKVAQMASIIRFIEKNNELGKGEELLILEKYD